MRLVIDKPAAGYAATMGMAPWARVFAVVLNGPVPVPCRSYEHVAEYTL